MPYLLSLLVLFCCLSAHAQETPTDQNRIDNLDGSLHQLFEDLRLPGMAAGIVKNGELWWFKGYGYADIENEVPVTRDTPYHLASLTKTFASTLLMRLVQEGELDLDTPISKFGVSLESTGIITVRHLFSHTSNGNPGEHYAYDGSRFGKLDRVMRRVSGNGFKQSVEDSFVVELGLENTGSMHDELDTPLAKPYELNTEGKLELGRYPSYFGSSAGLVASIADYAKYLKAIEANQYLTAETQALAWTPTMSTLGHPLPYGLGWFTEEFAGKKLIWHYGHWNCISTLVLMVPSEKLTFLAFTNTDHFSRGFALGQGSVLTSPVGLPFLKAFVFDENSKFKWPKIDWTGDPDEIGKQIRSAEGEDVKTLLSQELWTKFTIPHTARNPEGIGRMRQIYRRAQPSQAIEALRGKTELARIDRVGPSQDLKSHFTLKKPTMIHIVGVGEYSQGVSCDYGWIENRTNSKIVWQMTGKATTHAGGNRDNRLSSATLRLPAGDYSLRYKSDAGHDYASWNRRAPDGLFWGIVVTRSDKTR